MARFTYPYYTIFDFENVQNQTLKLCLGIIGYLYFYRLTRYKTSYVPSRFIIPFNRKCGIDIQDYLEREGYIKRYIVPNNQPKTINNFVVNDENYKKDAKIYLVTNKLRTLRQFILTNNTFIRLIDRNLHHLNGQYFNHYYHSYRHIKVAIPRNLLSNIPHTQRIWMEERLSQWGHPEIKSYNPDEFGWDNNEWAGAHINDFKLLWKGCFNYTSLGEVIEIGIQHCTPVILADLLLKSVGKNDYSDFFKRDKLNSKTIPIKTNINKTRKRKSKNKPEKKKVTFNPLFETANDYNVYSEIPYLEYYAAIYGYEYVESFANRFPGAWNHLYLIKRGWFEDFAKGVKPIIFKNDIRLFIDKKHPAFKRGQLYYKIVPLVIASIKVKIMRELWMKLKGCGIMFIPGDDCTVVVSKKYETSVTYILNKILLKHFDKSLRFEVGTQDLKNVPTLEQTLSQYKPYESPPEEYSKDLLDELNGTKRQPKGKPLF